MGFRFRSSIKIFKGVRLNLGKTGASLSLGGRGGTVNIGKRGVTSTVGLPGTGISYSTRLSGSGREIPRPQSETPKSMSSKKSETVLGLGCLTVVVYLILVAVIGKENKGAIILGMITIGGLTAWQSVRKSRADAAAEALATQQEIEKRLAYTRVLESRYGDDGARRIQAKRLWIGCPHDGVVEMFGQPEATEEKVTATSVTKTLKYFGSGSNRFQLRVTVTNGEVAGWDDKR